jgi:hypothetical protein
MKKVLTFLFLFLLLTHYSKGQVLMDENFNYTAGDSLGAHGWVTFSGTTNTLVVVSPGLSFTGYVNSNIGNAARVRNNGYDAYKQFAGDSAGNIYCAFMVKVDSALTGDYFLALLPDNSTTNYTGRVFAKDSSGLIAFGVSKSTNPIVYTVPSYLYGSTYLLVVKYTFLTGSNTDDEVRLFVITGTVPVIEPAPTIGPVTQAITDAPNISRVALRQGTATSSPTVTLDGIRVSKSWSNLISGITPISTIAEKFSLGQNYPNPFNPSTTIQFSIPNKSHVELKIYDAVGREISTVINEKLNSGTYEFDFRAADYPSGVYFYKLLTDAFTETKKMVLLK